MPCQRTLRPRFVYLCGRPWASANLKQGQHLLKCLPSALLIWLLLAHVTFNRPSSPSGEYLDGNSSSIAGHHHHHHHHLLLQPISCSSLTNFKLSASLFSQQQQPYPAAGGGRKQQQPTTMVIMLNSSLSSRIQLQRRAARRLHFGAQGEVKAEEGSEDEDDEAGGSGSSILSPGELVRKRRSIWGEEAKEQQPQPQRQSMTTLRPAGNKSNEELSINQFEPIKGQRVETGNNLIAINRTSNHEWASQHEQGRPEDGSRFEANLTMNMPSGGPLASYRWPFVGLVSFIFVGATGNILVCAAIMRERRLQTATNYFLLSLAVADLLVCTLVMPFGIIYEFYGQWPFDWRICNLWVTWDVLTCSSSILHMCFISVGRYLGIRNPLHARQTLSRRAVLWRIALAWISAALIASPLTMMSLYDHRNIVPSETECAISNKYFLIFGSMLAFFIPMFVMVWSYVMTVRLLRRRAKYVRNSSLLLTHNTSSNNNNTTSQSLLESSGQHKGQQDIAIRSSGPPINSPSSSSSSCPQINLSWSAKRRRGEAGGGEGEGGRRRLMMSNASHRSFCGRHPSSIGGGGNIDGSLADNDRPFGKCIVAPWKRFKLASNSFRPPSTITKEPQSQQASGVLEPLHEPPGAGLERANVAKTNSAHGDDNDGGCPSVGKLPPWLEQGSCHERARARARTTEEEKMNTTSSRAAADLFAPAGGGADEAYRDDDDEGRPIIGLNRLKADRLAQIVVGGHEFDQRTVLRPVEVAGMGRLNTMEHSSSSGNQHHGHARRRKENDEPVQTGDSSQLSAGSLPDSKSQMALSGQMILSATRFIDDEDTSYLSFSGLCQGSELTSSSGIGSYHGCCRKIVACSASYSPNNISIVGQTMERELAKPPFGLMRETENCKLARCVPAARISNHLGLSAVNNRQPPEAAFWKRTEAPERSCSENAEATGLVPSPPSPPLLPPPPPPPPSNSYNSSLATCCSFNLVQQMGTKFSLSTSLLPAETCSIARFNLNSSANQHQPVHQLSICPMLLNSENTYYSKLVNGGSETQDCAQQGVVDHAKEESTSNLSCSCLVANSTKPLAMDVNWMKINETRDGHGLDPNDDCDRVRREGGRRRRKMRPGSENSVRETDDSEHEIPNGDGHQGKRHQIGCHQHVLKPHYHHHRDHQHHLLHHHHHHHQHHQHHHHRQQQHCKHQKCPSSQPEPSGDRNLLNLEIGADNSRQQDPLDSFGGAPKPEQEARGIPFQSDQQRPLPPTTKDSSEPKPVTDRSRLVIEPSGSSGELGTTGPAEAPFSACDRRLTTRPAAMAAPLPTIVPSSAVVIPRRRRCSTPADSVIKIPITRGSTTTGSVSPNQNPIGGSNVANQTTMGPGGQQQQQANDSYDEPQMIRYLGSSMQVRSEQKATKVLGVVFFTFVICWSPFFVINFTQAFVERRELAKWISNEMMTTFLWLGYISSTINPVIYTVFNRNFRNAFRQILLCQAPSNNLQFGSIRSRAGELTRTPGFRVSQTSNRTNQLNGPPFMNMSHRGGGGGRHQKDLVHQTPSARHAASKSAEGGHRKGPTANSSHQPAHNPNGPAAAASRGIMRPLMLDRTNRQVHQTRDILYTPYCQLTELQSANQALLDETIPGEFVVSSGLTQSTGQSPVLQVDNSNPRQGLSAAANWANSSGSHHMAWALKSALKSSSNLITSLSGGRPPAGMELCSAAAAASYSDTSHQMKPTFKD